MMDEVAKVLSEALNNQGLVQDTGTKDFHEELFIATMEGVPVAYIANSNTMHREYGYLVTTCAIFSAVWYTTSYETRQRDCFYVATLDNLVYFMQFGYLLFVWKVSNLTPVCLIETTLQLASRALTFFFTPQISEYLWLQKHASIYYSIQENTCFLSCMKELLYGERLLDPCCLIGAIRCMPSPYPEGRAILADSLRHLLKDALDVILFHDPSKRFVAATRNKQVVSLSAQELELYILLSKISKKHHLDICGYIQLEHSYQLVSLVSDTIKRKHVSVEHDWLLLFVVKRENREYVMNKWHQYEEYLTQILETSAVQKDVDGFLHNPLTCKVISDHLKIPFSVHAMFYHREWELLVDTFDFSNRFEKDTCVLRKVWTKEKAAEIIIHRENDCTWLFQSIGDNPPVNIVVLVQCQLDKEYLMQLLKNIEKWFYRKQMSLFPQVWMEYFKTSVRWTIWNCI